MLTEIIKQILSDVDGQGSSKRMAAIWLLAIITVIAISVTFEWAKLNNTIWTDLVIMFGICIGAITSEKFTKRKPSA
jgi:hypothetical protein